MVTMFLGRLYIDDYKIKIPKEIIENITPDKLNKLTKSSENQVSKLTGNRIGEQPNIKVWF